jgi:hypothetical protein
MWQNKKLIKDVKHRSPEVSGEVEGGVMLNRIIKYKGATQGTIIVAQKLVTKSYLCSPRFSSSFLSLS